MDKDTEDHDSNLFLVRLWLESDGGEENSKLHGWHGKVQHVITGKAGFFSSQSSMMDLLASMSASSAQQNTKSVSPADIIATDTQQQT